jgi:hypothetical protein
MDDTKRPPTRPVSKAPSPITPVRGGARVPKPRNVGVPLELQYPRDYPPSLQPEVERAIAAAERRTAEQAALSNNYGQILLDYFKIVWAAYACACRRAAREGFWPVERAREEAQAWDTPGSFVRSLFVGVILTKGKELGLSEEKLKQALVGSEEWREHLLELETLAGKEENLGEKGSRGGPSLTDFIDSLRVRWTRLAADNRQPLSEPTDSPERAPAKGSATDNASATASDHVVPPEEAQKPGETQGSSNTTSTNNREKVDAYIALVLEKTGVSISREDIWRRAGYTDRAAFGLWQRGDDNVSPGAARKFEVVLALNPAEWKDPPASRHRSK